jgi:tight adherence protein C
MNPALLAICCGILVGVGIWAVTKVVIAPVNPRLDDSLELLDKSASVSVPAEGIDRLGSWLLARLRRPVSAKLTRRLRMSGRSLDRHFTGKLSLGLVGLLAPLITAVVAGWLIGFGATVIAVAALPMAALGFFLPDMLLAAGEQDLEEDATEALLTYFDLVTLERLANQSAPQALRAAASISDVPVFVSIRETLERARLEQRAPYAQLRQLSNELGLPALGDIADVMSLDEAGASLASALQARVRELRDAHLTNAKVAAADISERMTFFMVVPALVFAGFFLVPPILRLLAG